MTGKAAERLPSIDELFGLDEKADTLAAAAANLAVRARRLSHDQVMNDLGDDAPIPGFAPEPDGAYEVTALDGERIGSMEAKRGERFRTFAQQRALADKGVTTLLEQADAEGILEKTKELTQDKIRELLVRDEQMREMLLAEQVKKAKSNGAGGE